MSLVLIGQYIGTLVAIGGGVGAIWVKVIRPIIDWFRKMLGLIESIEKEFKPNGGGSIRDSLNRIELRQIIADQRAAALDMDSIKGVWETDAKGKCIRTNRTYQRLTGLSEDAALGYGWLNAVHRDDRERVSKEWESAVAQQREAQITYRIHVGKEDKQVVSVGYPLRWSGSVHGYVGILIEDNNGSDVFFDHVETTEA